MSACENHIVAISETWIQDGVYDAELFDDNYRVYRKDRDLEALHVTRGGGVLLAIRRDIPSTRVDLKHLEQVLPNVDILGCKLKISSQIIYIFVIYMQPNSPLVHYQTLFDHLSTLGPIHNHNLVLVGDFNLDYQRSEQGGSPSPKLTLLKDFMSFFDSSQFNNIFNSYNRLLDLVIANFPCTVERGAIPLVPEDAYHPTLAIKFDPPSLSYQNINFPTNSQNKSYNFRKANFPLLYQLISETDWGFLAAFTDVNEAVSAMYVKLYGLLDRAVPPFRPQKHKYSYPCWYTGDIIRQLKEKSRLHNKWKISKSATDFNNFKALRTSIKIKIDTAYRDFVTESEVSIVNDPKKFWKFVRQKQNKSRIPGEMSFGDATFDTPDGIVNAFASYFKSVYVDPSPTNNQQLNDDSNDNNIAQNITIYAFDHSDVLTALKSLKNKETAGPDGFPSFLLRDCASVLVEPVLAIFNLSISKGVFPDLWKRGKICPIHKSGDNSHIDNYRPISILTNFSKAFEACVYNKLFYQVKHLISPNQHGFYPSRSTVTNLTTFLNTAFNAINDKQQLDVVYTDFSKAFDKLDHNILNLKLRTMGFHNTLLSFFASYLCDRGQFVEYSGYRSQFFLTPSGAPQGSVLAPFLFSLFINDICKDIFSHSLLFADDMKIFRIVRGPEDCRLLQQDLDQLGTWCDRNCLPLNVQKCKKMTISLRNNVQHFDYTLCGASLPDSEAVRDLGVVVDRRLSFNSHIDQLVSSALKTLGFVTRVTSEFANIASRIAIYNSLVRSKLLYAAPVWFPNYNVHVSRLELVQRRFLKTLSYKIDGVYPPRGVDQGQLLNRFNLLSLRHSTVCASLTLLYKLCNGSIDASDLLSQINFSVPQFNSRRHSVFCLSARRTNVACGETLHRACAWFNKMNTLHNLDIFNLNLKGFKGEVLLHVHLV